MVLRYFGKSFSKLWCCLLSQIETFISWSCLITMAVTLRLTLCDTGFAHIFYKGMQFHEFLATV